MAQPCSKCSRVNPAEASYCYYDGSLLDGHAQNGGAVRGGTQSFPSHFVFPSGLICRNYDQLAQACQENWPSAVELLQQGYLENFLGGLGRADLAFAAREASRFPDRDRGLDQLLSRLPTNVLEAPKLHAEPRDLNLGVMQVDDNRQFELHLVNNGSRLLYGTVTADDCKWLTLGDAPGTSQKVFQFGTDVTIPVQVRGANLRAGSKPLEGRLLIESNGGNTAVMVRCEVPVRPFTEGVLAGAKSPRQVAEKAKAAPKEAAALFEKGVVADWYKANGWTYPVQGPSAAGLGAVQQFFEALGLTAPPKVDINEKFINFQGVVGASLRHTLEVKAQEKRPVFAHGTSDQPWLVVEKAQLNGRTAIIGVTVPSVPPMPGETLQGRVTVTSNGNQRFVVPVNLTVTGGYAQPIMLDSPQAPVMMEPGAPFVLREAPVFAEVQPVHTPVMAATPIMAMPSNQPMAVPAIVPGMPPHGPAWAHPPGLPMTGRMGEPAMPRRAARKKPLLVHLIPLFVLGLGLLGMVIHDLLLRPDTDPVDPTALVEVNFLNHPLVLEGRHDDILGDQSLRFGITLPKKDAVKPSESTNPQGKIRLTYHFEGASNNTCVQIDDQCFMLGSGNVGRWVKLNEPLGYKDDGPPDQPKRKRVGGKSVYRYDASGIEVTQIVEIIPSEQPEPVNYKGTKQEMLRLNRVLVRYMLENKGDQPHRVGIRFLLDTFIGTNDGVPFTIPGAPGLITTKMEFDRAKGQTIPDFIQALENADIANPGTVAHLSLKVPGLNTLPNRVTLGIWPKKDLSDPAIVSKYPEAKLANGHYTLWEVPFLDMQLLKELKSGQADSAITMYWNPEELKPGGPAREVGFIYGLGDFEGAGGKIGITISGVPAVGQTLTVTALINDPKPGQTAKIILPAGFQLVGGSAELKVPIPEGAGAVKNSPVTWQIEPTRKGKRQKIQVKSGDYTQNKFLRIKTKRAF